MSHTVEINASEHPVSSVTVYQRRAEVVRNFALELEAGQSEVEITKLPTCMDESSLRVDGLGNAVIFDVIYERVSPALNVPKASSEAVRALEVQEAALRRELKVLRAQMGVLDEFSKTLTAKDVSPAQLVEFLGTLQEKGSAFEQRLEETEKKLGEVQTEIAQARRGQVPSEETRKLATKVTVVVLAEQAGPAELTVTYVVSNADWNPLYDLRATVEPSGKGTTSVSLNYRASIVQTTGEDWKDVGLVLSTTSPLTGAHIPALEPQRIGAPIVPMVRSVGYGRPQRKEMKRMRMAVPLASAPGGRGGGGNREEESDDDMGFMLDEGGPPPMMEARMTTAREGTISTSFHIEGLSSIPSDGATHKVAIGVLDLTANLEWITVPKFNTSAFLQCQITNSSTYVLLPGPSNVFLDGSFVSKSDIPYVSPQDTFPCSVGVDPSLRISYPPVSKKARTQATGGIFNSSKLDSTLFTQRISIKNTRQSPVRLLVRDQVPVSEDQRFKVGIVEPKDLGGARAGEEVRLSQEAFCYWARKDWDAGEKGTVSGSVGRGAKHKSSQADVPDGQVEWVVSLAPGKSTELALSWEIAAPQGEKWVTR